MKKIKNIIIHLVVVSSVCLISVSVFMNRIVAAGSASINGPDTLVVGESATISYKASNTKNTGFQFSIVSSDNSVISSSVSVYDDSFEKASISGSFTVSGLKVGSATLRITSNESVDDTGAAVTFVAEHTIKVVEKSTGGNTGGNTGGGTGGGNTGGNSGGTTTNPSETPTVVRPSKVALVSSMNVVSASEKNNGQVIASVTTAVDVFAYAVEIPTRIDAFKINAVGVDAETTLTYDTDYSFAEGETTKEVTVTAVKGDVQESYTLSVNRKLVVSVPVTVADKTYSIYSDERLDAILAGLGFVKTDYSSNDLTVSYFLIGSVKVQLLSDAQNNAYWAVLDENNAVRSLVYLMIDSNQKPFFIESKQTGVSDTLLSLPYEAQSLAVSDLLHSIDSSLTFSAAPSGWSYQNGLVVYGFGEDGVENTFFVNPVDNSVTRAIIAFDRKPTFNALPWIVAGGSFIALAGIGVFELIRFRKLKKQRPIGSSFKERHQS